MAEKAKETQGANRAATRESLVAKAMANIVKTDLPVPAMAGLARVASSEVPKDWGPMAALFKSSPEFQRAAAGVFYASYTGEIPPIPRTKYFGFTVVEESFMSALESISYLKECMATTKGDAALSLEFTRKVMHDFILTYAKDLSSPPFREHILCENLRRQNDKAGKPDYNSALHSSIIQLVAVNGSWDLRARVLHSIDRAHKWLIERTTPSKPPAQNPL